MFFFERTDGAERDDPFDAELFEAVDVGAKVQLRRRDAMAAAVAGKKRYVFAGETSEHVVVRRPAPRAVEQNLFVLFKVRAWSTSRCRR